jgi:hypothetical protein
VVEIYELLQLPVQQCLRLPILLAHSDHNVRTKCLVKIIFIIEVNLFNSHENDEVGNEVYKKLQVTPLI